jgi:isopentenyl phosphate kinase
MSETIFLKLGGSLITDKTRPQVARVPVIRSLARQVRAARDACPDLQLVLGHGSGSFGHVAASQYGTRQGVHSARDWHGFVQVAAAAAQLNRIVTDLFLAERVPVLSLPPSASARCQAGALVSLELGAVRAALDQGLVPLVYGDVAFDLAWGGTIVSTEDVFVYLADELTPQRILLAGLVPGVYAADGTTVTPIITPLRLPRLRPALSGSHGTDVTGGMVDKVTRMQALVERHAGMTVHIFSGQVPGLLRRVLLDSDVPDGTRVISREVNEHERKS